MPYMPPPKRFTKSEPAVKNDWDFWWNLEATKKLLKITNPGLNHNSGLGAKRLHVASLVGSVNQLRGWYRTGDGDHSGSQMDLRKYSTAP